MVTRFRNRIKKEKIEFARGMRKEPTKAEAILWKALRKHGLYVKFKRQVPIVGYIVDFYTSVGNLVVEVDGNIHEQRKAYDKKRDEILKAKGFKVIRFLNEEVENSLLKVLEDIKANIIIN